MKRAITNRLGWARLSLVGLMGLVLVASAEVWSSPEMAQRRGGFRGGARGHHRIGSAPRHRAPMRAYGRGSMRYHRPAARPRNPGPRRHAARPPSSRRPGAGRTPGRPPAARNPIRRTPSHGSIRNRHQVDRSFTERRRDAAREHARSLRDLRRDRVDGPGDLDADRVDRVRRRALRRTARRYRWGNAWWWYDYGYWWQPYYDDDEQWYVQVDPPAGIGIDTLPVDAEPVEGVPGLYVANGVYYQQQPDGTYVIVPAPDDGMPDPITIARRSLDYVGKLTAFTLTATDTMDHVQEDGQKIQSETQRVFELRRPDALAATANGDDVDRLFWYDGKQLTIVDRRDKVAAQAAAPGSIDETIDFVIDQLSISLPLVDFLYSDPFGGLQDAMGDAEYLGLMDVGAVAVRADVGYLFQPNEFERLNVVNTVLGEPELSARLMLQPDALEELSAFIAQHGTDAPLVLAINGEAVSQQTFETPLENPVFLQSEMEVEAFRPLIFSFAGEPLPAPLTFIERSERPLPNVKIRSSPTAID